MAHQTKPPKLEELELKKPSKRFFKTKLAIFVAAIAVIAARDQISDSFDWVYSMSHMPRQVQAVHDEMERGFAELHKADAEQIRQADENRQLSERAAMEIRADVAALSHKMDMIPPRAPKQDDALNRRPNAEVVINAPRDWSYTTNENVPSY